MTESSLAPSHDDVAGQAAYIVDVDESVFPLEVLLKAVYWMTGRYDVDIKRDAPRGLLRVEIRGIDKPLPAAEGLEAERRLRRDLIDFRTRRLVDDETRMIRELLVAKAFDDGIEP